MGSVCAVVCTAIRYSPLSPFPFCFVQTCLVQSEKSEERSFITQKKKKKLKNESLMWGEMERRRDLKISIKCCGYDCSSTSFWTRSTANRWDPILVRELSGGVRKGNHFNTFHCHNLFLNRKRRRYWAICRRRRETSELFTSVKEIESNTDSTDDLNNLWSMRKSNGVGGSAN